MSDLSRADVERFLIFSQPRCGSTNLMRALNCHPGLRCCHEPFAPERRPGGSRCATAEDLDATLAEVWQEFNGVKHVWVWAGWPFEMHSPLNRHLLLHAAANVVFLNRRNILQQAVSDQIAVQTRLFNMWEGHSWAKLETFDFEPLDEELIEGLLDRAPAVVAANREALRAVGIRTLDLWYEDLYGPDEAASDRVETLGSILRFLGCDIEDEGLDRKRIEQLLDPDRSKVNSTATYLRVPGIREIEERYGSDETGWLFR